MACFTYSKISGPQVAFTKRVEKNNPQFKSTGKARSLSDWLHYLQRLYATANKSQPKRRVFDGTRHILILRPTEVEWIEKPKDIVQV